MLLTTTRAPGDGTKRHRSPGHLQPGRVLSAADVPRRHTTLARLRELNLTSTSRRRPEPSDNGSAVAGLTIARRCRPLPSRTPDGVIFELPALAGRRHVTLMPSPSVPWAQQRPVVEHGPSTQRYHHQGGAGRRDLHARHLWRPVTATSGSGLGPVFSWGRFCRATLLPTYQSTRDRASSRAGQDWKTTTVAGVLALLASSRHAAGQRLHVGWPRRLRQAAVVRVRGAVVEVLSGDQPHPEDATVPTG